MCRDDQFALVRRTFQEAAAGRRRSPFVLAEQLLQDGSRICTGLCSTSPTKTARSVPDASLSTDEPGGRVRAPG